MIDKHGKQICLQDLGLAKMPSDLVVLAITPKVSDEVFHSIEGEIVYQVFPGSFIVGS